MFNTHLRDQLLYLKSSASAFVATNETRANAAYAALTTASSLTVVTDTQAWVICSLTCGNNTSGGISLMGFTVSGATTTAASDAFAVGYQFTSATQILVASGAWLVPLTAGSNTFTTVFRSNGTDIASFSNRRLGVIPA